MAQDIELIGKSFWTISYFGEKVFHTGLQLSVNRSIYLSKNVEKQKNRFDLGLSIISYLHPKNHIGLRMTPTFSFIHATKKGFEYGIKADAGFMRRFYQGKVFEVDNNGNVTQKYLAGQNSVTYGTYIVLAKNWYSSKSKNIRLFAEVGGFQETNYNTSNLLHTVMSIGISKYFNLKK
jgi:hypothetical protein